MRLLPILLVSTAGAAQDREATLGARIAREVRSTATIVHNTTVRDYVSRPGSRLLSHVTSGTPAYSFDVIVESASSRIHEPVAIIGGHVFVRTGLFLAAGDEAEFAGILAHGIAHVSERHGMREYSEEPDFRKVQEEVRRLTAHSATQRKAPSLRRQTPQQP